MNNSLKLYAPENYWNAINSQQDLSKILNGCGTDGWKGQLVPETLWGLSVTDACNIHDWMYEQGKTIADKEEADRVFLNNMVRTVNHHHANNSCIFGCIKKKLQLIRARTYYEAVKHFGGDAFWANVNLDQNFKAV